MANGTTGFLSAKVFAEDHAPHLVEEFTETVFSMETKSRFLVIKIMIYLENTHCAVLARDGIPAYQSVKLVADLLEVQRTAFMTKA